MDPPVTHRPSVVAVAIALAVGTTACNDTSGESKATPTTPSSGTASAPSSPARTGEPVTEGDVAEVDQVLHRLDSELDRLDSDMATGEGETQQVVLEAPKKRAAAAITRRVLALRDLTTAAKSIARLSETDRAALTNQLEQQISGLTSLNAKILGDTDEAAFRADAQRIVTDYRVYVLTIPRVRSIVAADIGLNAADRLTTLADRLAAAIDQSKGKDTTRAQADLASLRARLAAVTGTISPLPAGLLALQPAGYPANHAVLEQSRQALRTGRAGLADAAGLTRQMIADLK